MKAYYQHEVPNDTTTETGEVIPAGSPAIRILRNGAGGRLATSHQEFTLSPVTDVQKEAYADFLKTEWSIPVWEERVGFLEMWDKYRQESLDQTLAMYDELRAAAKKRMDHDEAELKALGNSTRLAYYALSAVLTYAIFVTILYAMGVVLK